ncbi:MAG: rhodanese-like domain-containing protein [Nanoarchaeota archaeon]
MLVKDISLKEAEKIAEDNENNLDFIIIDVRTAEEAHKCRFKNSINIDIFSKDFTKKLDKLDRNKTYLIHCRSGNRSREALKTMDKLGFKKIYHSSDGINCP